MASASGMNAPPSSPTGNVANPGPFDCVKKLTHEQVKRGWREGFSTTEKRPYYYNIFTRESVWYIPCILTQQEESQADPGPAVDLLAAAMGEISGKPPMEFSEPPFVKGKSTKKRNFTPDPDQEENEKNAVRFHIGDTSIDNVAECRSRMKTLTKRILTKFITDQILQLVYHAQEQLGCEGCDEDWPSQWDHQCMFFGMNPECRIHDFVSDYLEEAMQLVDMCRVLPVFQAMISRLGVGRFAYEGMDLDDEVNSMITDILNEWKVNPSDISHSFYSHLFNNVTELIEDVLQRMNY